MGRVMVLGSLNVDLVTDVDRHPRPGETVLGGELRRHAGGKGANQAVAARRAGGEVAMVGCVGADADGTAYLDRLGELGIDTSGIRTVAGVSTGHALIVIDDLGENTVVVTPGANGHVGPDEVAEADSLGPGDVLLLQLEVPRRAVCAAVRGGVAAGARVVVNAAPYAALPPDIVALADPLVVNEHEAAALAEAGVIPRSLLVTFGEHGAVWDGQRFDSVEVPAAEVVDTTGAGDAFCGALAAALARGAGHDEAMAAALAAGADATRHAGAQPGGLLP